MIGKRRRIGAINNSPVDAENNFAHVVWKSSVSNSRTPKINEDYSEQKDEYAEKLHRKRKTKYRDKVRRQQRLRKKKYREDSEQHD